jgi:hypothetical protein
MRKISIITKRQNSCCRTIRREKCFRPELRTVRLFVFPDPSLLRALSGIELLDGAQRELLNLRVKDSSIPFLKSALISWYDLHWKSEECYTYLSSLSLPFLELRGYQYFAFICYYYYPLSRHIVFDMGWLASCNKTLSRASLSGSSRSYLPPTIIAYSKMKTCASWLITL